jgi:hypothetical protein
MLDADTIPIAGVDTVRARVIVQPLTLADPVISVDI